jgi:hypothetical protein
LTPAALSQHALTAKYACGVRRIALLALVLVLATAPAAMAHTPFVDSDPITEAVKRAIVYWHGTPCAGQVTITAGFSTEAPPAGANAPTPNPRAAMWATWQTPIGPNSFLAPPSTFTDCAVHIDISSRYWPSWHADDEDFPAFCKGILHEYGHFEGYPDVGASAGTIEYERPDLAHVPLCERYRLVFGRETYTGGTPKRARTHRPKRSSHAGHRPGRGRRRSVS